MQWQREIIMQWQLFNGQPLVGSIALHNLRRAVVSMPAQIEIDHAIGLAFLDHLP